MDEEKIAADDEVEGIHKNSFYRIEFDDHTTIRRESGERQPDFVLYNGGVYA